MSIKQRLRNWLGIDGDLSRTMLMMTRMDRRLTTRLDVVGMTAELIAPNSKARADWVEKRLAKVEERLGRLERALDSEPPRRETAPERIAIAVEEYRKATRTA